MKNYHTWVVVADKCQAKIFLMEKAHKLKEIFHLEHPESGLHNRDLISSKPGRGFQSIDKGTTRSAYQPETEPKQIEAIKFASEIASLLYSASTKGEFQNLYLIADPSFLGLLRQHIHPQIQKHVIAEIPKELTQASVETIEHQISALSF